MNKNKIKKMIARGREGVEALLTLCEYLEGSLQEPLDEKQKQKKEKEKMPADFIKSLIARWNKLPRPIVSVDLEALSPARRARIRTRWADPYWRANWEKAIDLIPKSDWHMGRINDWSATLDWFLKPNTVVDFITRMEQRNAAAIPSQKGNIHEL